MLCAKVVFYEAKNKTILNDELIFLDSAIQHESYLCYWLDVSSSLTRICAFRTYKQDNNHTIVMLLSLLSVSPK